MLDVQEILPSSLPETPFPVQLTAKAAAMVQEAMHSEGLEAHGLRVGVLGGGCSGLEYLLDFTPDGTSADWTATQHGVRLFIDPYSAAHLAGTTIDYVDALQGTGFKFNNPNIVRACGCGSSFQT